jgi:hypothetical protein
MTEPLVTKAGEQSIEDLLAALEGGRRVVVQTTMGGTDHEVTLRADGETFYCDTPTRLHKHDTIEEMRECIEQQGYAKA